jgi:hypothetical protein
VLRLRYGWKATVEISETCLARAPPGCGKSSISYDCSLVSCAVSGSGGNSNELRDEDLLLVTRGCITDRILASCEFIGNSAVKTVALDSLRGLYRTVLQTPRHCHIATSKSEPLVKHPCAVIRWTHFEREGDRFRKPKRCLVREAFEKISG